MSPEAMLLDALEAAGLAVFIGEDGGLKCKGPSRRLTPALKAEVEALRPELTALVACRPSSTPNPVPLGNPRSEAGAPWPPEGVLVDHPAKHWQAYGKGYPEPLAATLEAIATAWDRGAVVVEASDVHRQVTKAKRRPESLRREYSRLVAWAEHDPSLVSAPWLAEQAAGWVVARRRAPAVEQPPWTGTQANLMSWAAGLTVDDLPPAPFALRPGVTAQGAALWLASLQEDVAIGPRGPRARTGALQQDVETLWAMLAPRVVPLRRKGAA